MSRDRSIVITKRDGTLERFSLEKLRSCLARTLAGSGGDPRLAAPLAQAVALHLRETAGDDPPTADYIFNCARAALCQTGLDAAAHALIAHRHLRWARRRQVRVYDPLESGRPPVRWRKGALVATLQRVYDLRQAVARFLAAAVEERVFALGYGLLSKPFVAELLRNEVMAWGLLLDHVPAVPRPAVPQSLASSRPPQED